MSSRYNIEVDRAGKVLISGIIDEGAELGRLQELHGNVELDLSEVRRINSFGVRMWIDAMRKIPGDANVSIVRCAPPMIEQMNMIHNFFGPCRLHSFYAPMICPECDELQNQLFEVTTCRANGGKLPAVSCPACGETMEVDDIEEQYLFFLGVEG